MNHSNLVVFDEPTITIGAALHAAIAIRRLGAGGFIPRQGVAL